MHDTSTRDNPTTGGWSRSGVVHDHRRPHAPLGINRRQVDGHANARLLGGVDAVDRVVTGALGCGVFLIDVGVCLFLSLRLLAMCESGRVSDS